MTVQEKVLELTMKYPMLSSANIADRIGCHSAYVRAVWHRNGIFKGRHDARVSYCEGRKYVRVPIDEYERLVDAASRGNGD